MDALSVLVFGSQYGGKGMNFSTPDALYDKAPTSSGANNLLVVQLLLVVVCYWLLPSVLLHVVIRNGEQGPICQGDSCEIDDKKQVNANQMNVDYL